MIEYAKQKQSHAAQVFEKPEVKKDYIINKEENDEYLYVQVVPPQKE